MPPPRIVLPESRFEGIGSPVVASAGHRIIGERQFLRRPGLAESLREAMHLRVIGGHCLCVTYVSFVAREDVSVKVPHVLVACGFIVLACRNTVASVRRFHCECRFSNRSLNRSAERARQFVDDFVVLNRDDQSRPGIGRLPPWAHLRHDVVVAMKNFNGEGSSARHDSCCRMDRRILRARDAKLMYSPFYGVSKFGPSHFDYYILESEWLRSCGVRPRAAQP